MTIPARVFVLILVVTRAARPQTPEELAQTAAHAMQHQDYATAEKAYRSLSSCLRMSLKCTATWV